MINVSYNNIEFKKKNKKRKTTSCVKEVWFKDSFRFSMMLAFTDDVAEIFKHLKSWCNSHSYNINDVEKIIWT